MFPKKSLLSLTIIILIVFSNDSLTQTKTDAGKKVNMLLAKLEHSPEGPERVIIFKDLCKEYRLHYPEKALYYGNLGLELAKKIDFQKGIADCCNSIAVVYKYQGNYQQALEYYF
jgi:hypothetical protein